MQLTTAFTSSISMEPSHKFYSGAFFLAVLVMLVPRADSFRVGGQLRRNTNLFFPRSSSCNVFRPFRHYPWGARCSKARLRQTFVTRKQDNLLGLSRPQPEEDREVAGKKASLAYTHENLLDVFSNVDDIIIMPLPEGSSSENDVQQLNPIFTGITERYLEPGDRLGEIDNIFTAIADEQNRKNLSSEHLPVLATSEILSEALLETLGETHGNDNRAKIPIHLNEEHSKRACGQQNENCIENDTSEGDRDVLQNNRTNTTPLVHSGSNNSAIANRTGVNFMSDAGQYTPGSSSVGEDQFSDGATSQSAASLVHESGVLDDNEGLILERITKTAISFCNRRKIGRFEHLLQIDGSFRDIEYNSDKNALRVHGGRLCSLVFARLFTGEEVSEFSDEEDALDGFYYVGATRNNLTESLYESFRFLAYAAPLSTEFNWWQHVIGTPSCIWQALFLARRHLPRQLVIDIIGRFWKRGKAGPVWNLESKDGSMAGGNLGPRLLLSLVEAALMNTTLSWREHARAALVREAIHRDGWEGNGIRADGCVHQHNLRLSSHHKRVLGQLYSNNYGKEFFRNVAQVLWWVHGTPASPGPEVDGAVVASFLQCQVWLHRGTTAEPSSTGRFIDSGRLVTRVASQDSSFKSASVLRLLGQRTAELDAVVHRYRHACPHPQYALTGNKHFFSSDLMVHQRQSFFASVRLTSDRTSRPETFPGGANKDGYYQGDGWLTVLATGGEFGTEGREVFQVYDWSKLPGVTCPQHRSPPSVTYNRYHARHFHNGRALAGGASNGRVGVAALDLARPTSLLRARKSWHFFSDSVVSLGSDITVAGDGVASGGAVVATTLNQVRACGAITLGLHGGAILSELPANGSLVSGATWLHHDSIGYALLPSAGPQQMLHVMKDVRTTEGGIKLPVFKAWLDHGVRPKAASYAFALLPAASRADTAHYSNHPTAAALRADTRSHVVCGYHDQTASVVLWEAGCVDISLCLRRHDHATLARCPTNPTMSRGGADCDHPPTDCSAQDEENEPVRVDTLLLRDRRKGRNCVPLSTRKECQSKVGRCRLRSYPFTDRDWTVLADTSIMVCSDQPAVFMVRLTVHQTGHAISSSPSDDLHIDQRLLSNQTKVEKSVEMQNFNVKNSTKNRDCINIVDAESIGHTFSVSNPTPIPGEDFNYVRPSTVPESSNHLVSSPTAVTPTNFHNLTARPEREYDKYPSAFAQKSTTIHRLDLLPQPRKTSNPDSLLEITSPFTEAPVLHPLAATAPTPLTMLSALVSRQPQSATRHSSASVLPTHSLRQAQSATGHSSTSVLPTLSSRQVLSLRQVQPTTGYPSMSFLSGPLSSQSQPATVHSSASVWPVLSPRQAQPATDHSSASFHSQSVSLGSTDHRQWKTRVQSTGLLDVNQSSPLEASSTFNLLPPRDSFLLQMLSLSPSPTPPAQNTIIRKSTGSWYQPQSTSLSWAPPSAEGVASQTAPSRDSTLSSAVSFLPAAPLIEVLHSSSVRPNTHDTRVPSLRTRAKLGRSSPPLVKADPMVNISVQFPIGAASQLLNSSAAYEVTLMIIRTILSAINATVDDLSCFDKSSNKGNFSLLVREQEKPSSSAILQSNASLPMRTIGNINNITPLSAETTLNSKRYSSNMLHNKRNDTESVSEYYQNISIRSSFDEKLNIISLKENEDDNDISIPHIDERYRYQIHNVSGPKEPVYYSNEQNFRDDNSSMTEQKYTSDEGEVKVISKREAREKDYLNSYGTATTNYPHSVMTQTNNSFEYVRMEENNSPIVDISTFVDLSGVSYTDRDKYAYHVAGNSGSGDEAAYRTSPPPASDNTVLPVLTGVTRIQSSHNGSRLSYLLSKRVCLNISIADPQQLHDKITVKVLIRKRTPAADDIRRSPRPRAGVHNLSPANGGTQDGHGSASRASQSKDGARDSDPQSTATTERTVSRTLPLPTDPYRGSSINTLVCI